MSTFSALSTPLNLIKPVPGVTAAIAMSASETAKRAAIKKTAQDFESSFLTSAIGSMFQGVTISAPFGGGEGEEAFKSFLNEAMAKQIVQKGGIGVADAVQREMLKMQGLSPEPVK
ncbi:MAG TPA: rod-binding protein [Caulobacteraceae bacterium]|jgi:Rod binding domain-containing protein|nr:rod-binding protein [Caulobacteraceae bacterium]